MTIKTLTVASNTIEGGGVVQTTTALGAADTGFYFANDGKTSLTIKNGSASTITVTVQAKAKYGGLSLTNPTFTIIAGATKTLPFLDPSIFNDSSGLVQVDISTAATTVEGLAIKYK